MNNISAIIVGDSKSPQGHRITSLELVLPRIILAEMMTHRALSKNSASSRAIPFKKMVEMVQNNPFIPIAWQKHHTGMQGTEYLSKTDKFEIQDAIVSMRDTLRAMLDKTSKEYVKLEEKINDFIFLMNNVLKEYVGISKTLDEWWLFARDKAVEAASLLYIFGTTKQLCNRLLEPYMYHKVLITGTDEAWENFFSLRCPQYTWGYLEEAKNETHYRSRKDMLKAHPDSNMDYATEIEWLKINKGQAEIHMMDLAEKVWDAMNESTPKELKAGEWHIPYEDKITEMSKTTLQGETITLRPTQNWGEDEKMYLVKVATGMAAKVSYTTVGDEKEISYSTLIGIHDKMLNAVPFHASPFEHNARCMSDEEYRTYVKGEVEDLGCEIDTRDGGFEQSVFFTDDVQGWCRNYRGWIQYRHLIEEGKYGR